MDHITCAFDLDTSMNGLMLIFCLHCIKAVVSKTCGGLSDIVLNTPKQCVLWKYWRISIILRQVSESSSIQICCCLKCTSNIIKEGFFLSKTSNFVWMSLS